MLEAWGVWPPPTLPSLGWFLISRNPTALHHEFCEYVASSCSVTGGGCSGLGLVSAAWLVTQARKQLMTDARRVQDTPEVMR